MVRTLVLFLCVVAVTGGFFSSSESTTGNKLVNKLLKMNVHLQHACPPKCAPKNEHFRLIIAMNAKAIMPSGVTEVISI